MYIPCKKWYEGEDGSILWPHASKVWFSSSVASPTSSYILTEYFEGGTGFDSVGWSTIGNVTTSYATPPAPLQGAQSILLTAGSTLPRIQRYLTADSQSFNEVWLNLTVHPLLHNNGGEFIIFRFGTSLNQSTVTWRSVRTLRAQNGSAFGTTTATMETGSTYKIWLHYVMGTGANGMTELYFSTSSIRPASGSANYCRTIVGTATGSVSYVVIESENIATSGSIHIVDSLLVSSNEIVDV